MECRFSIGDTVEIKYRDETVIGTVIKINDDDFIVQGDGQEINLPNDVGSYVRRVIK